MNIKSLLVESISIIIGNLLLAFAVAFFIIPNDILTGGVAGVAIALSPLLNISVETIITSMMVICFVLGSFFLGKDFALKTIASSILYPVFLNIMSSLAVPLGVDPILASLYGGLISGLGIGIVFRVGASTGGMDVPPLILGKYTKIKTHSWMIIVDGLTILLGITTFGLNAALIGLISAYSMSKMVDTVQTLSGVSTKQVFIITDRVDEVLHEILISIDRGATILEAMGGYTKEPRKLIMTVLSTNQYAQLEKLVKEIDMDAFLIVSDATEVHGNGFYKN
ncbi:MAG TPA: YitT family protein [Erysipelothrix sp.]|nr:YitT family protein [Erysipelothrix sp.]